VGRRAVAHAAEKAEGLLETVKRKREADR